MRTLTLTLTLTTAVACFAASAALAQSKVDRAFTASSESCGEVVWSPETLAKYPRIASACRAVVAKDGKHYVKFEGEVTKVANRGQSVTVQFKNGDKLALAPPENLVVYVGNRKSNAASLRPGDELSFYVPEEQLAANFVQNLEEVETVPDVPILPAEERVAMATEEELPRTASLLPLAGLAGLALMGFGAGLTLWRRGRRR